MDSGMKITEPFYYKVYNDMQQLIDEGKFWGIQPKYSMVIRTNKFIKWLKNIDNNEKHSTKH